MKVGIGVTCMLFFLILAEETCDSELDDDCQVKKKDRKDKYSKGSFEVGRKGCFKLNIKLKFISEDPHLCFRWW